MAKKKRITKEEKDNIIKLNSRILRFNLKKEEIIGLDLGTTITGLYNNKFGSALWSSTSSNIYERINIIRKEFLLYLSFKKSKKCFFIIEDYAFAGQSVIQIAELGGIIKTTLYDLHMPFVAIAPTTLKKMVLGPSKQQKIGNKKQQIMVEVLSRWGVKFEDDNACDAFCLVKFAEYLRAYLNDEKIKEYKTVARDEKISERNILNWEKEMFKNFILNRNVICR